MGDLIGDLREALPNGSVLTDPDLLTTYRRDEAHLCAGGTPLAVVRPRSTAEVQATIRAAARHHTPVVPQGARTGLAGAANPPDGALVLSLTAMDRILSIDAANRLAVVQPGVVNAALGRAVAEHGLWYPPDPGSYESSTIGGNVATNAGGMCCVKYGVTTEYVLGLEVVLADGAVLRTGRRTTKGVAGYDLTRLFVGSEGTLGVITEIALALRPRPRPALTLAALFPTLASAGAAVSAIVASGATPSLLELLDRTHLRAIEAYRPMGLDRDAKALLLVAMEEGGVAPLCHEATEIYEATDPVEAAELLVARRLAYPAMERLARQRYLGGTITGEHGVGLLKRDWLATELGPVGLRVHRAIKTALDPQGLLNPGKVLP
jgi:glycolate oxidase